MSKYSDRQTRCWLAHEQKTFDRFMRRVEVEDEELFYRYVYRLLLRIYEMHLTGKYLTKMQACRLIPLRHQNVCQRYVDEAEAKGFIEFRPNPNDKRKTDIVPKQQLLAYVEERMERTGDELRITVSAAAREDPFPRDNLPLSEWRTPD